MANQDWQEQFRMWSSTGYAHPDSPAGGSGPGVSRLPGPVQSSGSRSAPSLDSPAMRLSDWQGQSAGPQAAEAKRQTAEEAPISGKMPVPLGLGSAIRIPVPGTNGLAVELAARGWTPKGGSTSSLFIQDVTGRRHLRLDYGFNKNTGMVEWHWNQKGVADVFGITNHTSAGTAGRVLGTAAKYYKYAGRVLLVVGAVADAYSIVVSTKPLRRTIQVVSAWATATAGCEAAGAGGAWLGTVMAPGLGTAIGGLVGCAVGGFIGYTTAESTAGYIYDWAEGTVFTKLELASAAAGYAGGGGQSGGGGASGEW